MKFRNGYWLLKSGVEEYPAAQVYDYRFRDGVLTLYCTVKKTEGRNETVNALLLTIELRCLYLTGSGRSRSCTGQGIWCILNTAANCVAVESD